MAQPTMDPAEYCFYLSKSGETRGPTHIAALPALKVAGEITDETMVWQQGFEKWLAFKDSPFAPRPPPVIDEPKKTTNAAKPNHENTAVFIQGLPPTVTAAQLSEYFAKCGIIKKDPITQQDKIKVYTNPQGEPNGEALVTFLLAPSVDLAIDLRDQAEFAPGYKISVSEAQFNHKGGEAGGDKQTQQQHQPNNAKRKKELPPAIQNKDQLKRVKQVQKMHEQLALSWSEGDGPAKESALCIVVLKNMFDPKTLLDGGSVALEELGKDIDEGIADFGEVKKVTVFKHHPDGVVLIRFTDPIDAEECVRTMRGRWFDGRRIDAHLWDGVTMYGSVDHDEKEKEDSERMDKFGEWLEQVLP